MSFNAWDWKQIHTITVGSVQTDYQVRFTVYKGSGTSSGESVYCNNHCNDDFSDIRFSTDGQNALPYWIESYTSGVSAIIWVKFASIGTSQQVNVYYGNLSATDDSDGENTFALFDDFSGATLDETKWVCDGTAILSSGILSVSGSGTNFYSIAVFPTNYALMARATIPNEVNNELGMRAASGCYYTRFFYSSSMGAGSCNGSGSTTYFGNFSGYHIWEIERNSSTSAIFKVDHTTRVTRTSYIPTTDLNGIRFTVQGGTYLFDWIVVRKYNSTLTHSTWEAEQENEDVPPLDFTFTPENPLYGTLVTFTASPEFYQHCFDFGDGEISYLNPATHIYQEPGSYLVTATACGSTGDPVYTATDTVEVTGDCEFYAKPVRGKVPLTVQFIDESDFADSWSWDFGDGSSSSDQHPVHTYQHAETYTVRLIITKGTKQTTLIKETYIGATESDPPVAGFTMSVREGNAPLTVAFTDASTGSITSSIWNFGDGSTSTETNPTHIYSVPGFYFVTRRVLNTEWESECIGSVHVEDPLYVSFSAVPISGYAPLLIRFRPIIEGEYERISWDFGDNSPVSTDWHPTHTYTVPGTYTVTLSVYQHSAYPVTTTKTLTIKDPAILPAADFTADIVTGLSPLEVSFTDISTGSPTSRVWTFGDGITSTATNPTHTYTNPGTYTVSLKVTNAYGYDTETKTGYITVVAAPVADFSADIEIGYITHEFSFTDESLYTPTSWEWTVDGVIVSTDQDMDHTFSSVGSHWVSLTVTNDYGTDTIGKDIFIVAAGYPIASFSYVFSSRVLPITVTFTDTSQGTPTSWLWDFGDGTTSTLQNPTHTYYHAGEYVVSLTVTNATGTMTTQKRIA
jgi:PKD repeat protein